MPRNNKKHAFTLVEAVVSVAITALLILIISRMMVGAMQMSQTGSSHLTNLLAADIVMQQLLEDLKQTRSINSDAAAMAAGQLSIERLTWDENSARPGITNVTWQLSPDRNGLIRIKGGEKHQFYPDRRFALEFRRVSIPPGNSLAMLVTLKVSTPPNNAEEQGFRRFVLLDSLPENRNHASSYQPVD